MPGINDLLHDIQPADLTEFARAVPERADFTLTNSVLPNVVINNVKYRTRNRSITVAAARYRSFNAPTPRLRSAASQSIKEGFLPPLGGLEDIEEFNLILAEIARGADDQRLLDGLYDNIENQVIGIRSRLELAAGDVLADGIINIDENGQLLTVDFGVPSANKPVASTLWSDTANARMVDDELAWIAVLANAGKPRPTRAITSLQVASLFARNQQYREIFWGGAVTGTTRPTLTPDEVNSVRGRYGLPPIEVYDVQVPVANEVTGVITSQRTIPANRFILLPPDVGTNFGETLYGLTAEGIILSMSSTPGIVGTNAPGLISTADVTHNPPSITTKTTAVALPVLHTPDAFVTAQVLA